MNRLCSVNNNFPFDNNLLVLDMVLSSLWTVPQPINWENVARLVPGFTPKEDWNVTPPAHHISMTLTWFSSKQIRVFLWSERFLWFTAGVTRTMLYLLYQCARRFDELKSTGSLPLVDDQCNMVTATSGSPSEPLSAYIRSTLSDLTGETAESRTSHSVLSVPGLSVTPADRGARAETESTVITEDRAKEDNGKSPTMVIHVCDEAKNLKQDFECPRHLLVKEMRYFSDYLSVDAQRWEEVDISVHCDIQIFDWLMSYVKRNYEEPEPGKHVERPKLEPSNVISILISSEFLKMDTLVEECIQFCHKHMSSVVATPCNMSCISSALVSRMAQLFTHNQAHNIKDKKDKFKSKLFQKKIEKLFDADDENQDSPGRAATLYRCGICQKLLTKDTERKIPCLPGKLNVDSRGNIVYTHSRHKGWDVHEYLNSLYEELKSWVMVYWRIWGTINYLTCSHCKQVFLCCELAQCRYHPQPVVFPGVGAERSWHGTGFYPCCNQRALRFDPTTMPYGCKIKDHVVCAVDSGDWVDNVNSVQTRVLNDLLLHRDAVCVSAASESDSSVESPAGGERVQDCDIMLEPGLLNVQRGGEITAFSLLKNWSLQLRQQSLLSEDEEYTTGSEVTEDEVGDEEDASKKQVPKKAKKSGKPLKRQVSSPSIQRREKCVGKVPSRDSTPFTVSVQMSKWDSTRSMRFNQDAQREEDQRRMVEIIDHLTKMRFGDVEQSKSKDIKEVPGGSIYSRLEAQFKSCTQSSKHSSSDKTLRLKTRSGPSRPT